MMKKLFCMALVLLGTLSLFAEEVPLEWRKNITLIAVPREPQAIQVAQDISHRYPVLLVCYQQSGEDITLHAWNGEIWVNVSTEDYVNGAFFKIRPQHTVIVENENKPAPDVLIPDGTWCDSGNRLASTDRRVMTHLLGRYFDFPYRYWMQFSKRYGYALEEINPALINVFWWHYRGDEVMPAFETRDAQADMDKWFFLDITPPEPIEPVVIEEELETILPAETPAEAIIEAPVDVIVETPVAEEIVEFPIVEILTEESAEIVEETVAVEIPIEALVEEVVEESVVEIDPFSINDIPAAELLLPAE